MKTCCVYLDRTPPRIASDCCIDVVDFLYRNYKPSRPKSSSNHLDWLLSPNYKYLRLIFNIHLACGCNSEAYSELCQTSKMEYFAKIVSGFYPLTIFVKCSMLNA